MSYILPFLCYCELHLAFMAFIFQKRIKHFITYENVVAICMQLYRILLGGVTLAMPFSE